MNIKDVTTIDELTEFMNAEAALWGRAESENAVTNGPGIQQQWNAQLAANKDFPCMILYMVGKALSANEIAENPFPLADDSPHVVFEITSMWFDDAGDKTDRPESNTDTLYHND